MTNNNGDILMLEAPPRPASSEQACRPWWSTGAEIIDALPYIDDDYGYPKVKEEVDRLVEDEMRRSSKKPSDFLNDLPPLPSFNFQVLSKHCVARVFVFRFSLRFRFSKMLLWALSAMIIVASVHSLRSFNTLFFYRMQSQAVELNEKIEVVNRERKYHQQNTAYELNALSAQWKELCEKNIEIQTACAKIENHIEEMKREATERGWNLDANIENGSLLHPEQ
ncbi:hypothetical protein TEA_026139 [Camellia sinensis var. sinensis]|uniref:Pre-mRNA-splicing factor SPF27 n=1 Tax=Camellia sinensis var. sinensis TaxID=542762 RepID=A0A4S4EAX9_CAMSN|nr:hypothetical protein TEA_026139 [Camellia sinensis var. sinensis]